MSLLPRTTAAAESIARCLREEIDYWSSDLATAGNWHVIDSSKRQMVDLCPDPKKEFLFVESCAFNEAADPDHVYVPVQHKDSSCSIYRFPLPTATTQTASNTAACIVHCCVVLPAQTWLQRWSLSHKPIVRVTSCLQEPTRTSV